MGRNTKKEGEVVKRVEWEIFLKGKLSKNVIYRKTK